MNPGNSGLVLPVIFLIFALRIWTAGARQRRVRIETMWIAPVIIVALIGAGIAGDPAPLTPLTITVMALMTVIGAAIGFFRGRMTRITIDPETHTLTSQNSALGMLILAGVYFLRYGVRTFLSGHAADWHLPPAAIADGFLLMVMATIIARRVEILIRCLRLLATAKADKAAGKTVAAEITEEHG